LKFFRKESGADIGSHFKGIFILAKGAVLARVIGLASIPVLTRIYSPEDYGVLALYTSLVMMLAPILTLRYVQAIPLPKTDGIAINLFFVCLKLILFGSFVSALIFSTFGSTILSWFDMHSLVSWWPLIVLGSAGAALYESLSLWATRKRQYKILAKTQITQSLLGNIAKIALGLIAIRPAGLLIGQFIAQSGGIGSLTKQSWRDFKKLKSRLSRKKCLFAAKYYRDFPFYRLPSHVLMVGSLQAPVLMMAALFNKELTGQLSLAILALSLPTSLIGSAVAKAYYAEIAALGKNNIGKIRKISFSVQKRLFSIGLPLTVLAALIGEFLFVGVFGEKWRIAGSYAALLAPFILFQFTSAPLMEVINVVGSQLNFLILHLLRILGLIGLFFLVKRALLDSDEFVLILSCYLSMFYFFASAFVFFILRRSS
jgi:O-antigen/teichoic acid export membrane protein